MGQGTPMELTKIKKIVADIQEFSGKIDSTEQAISARQLLKKYALLSEKIERNVLISTADQKDLAKIRTKEFKAIRQKLKEKANSVLHTKSTKQAPSEKVAKKTEKKPTAKKTPKADDESVAKATKPKKTVKKAAAKSSKDTDSKE